MGRGRGDGDMMEELKPCPFCGDGDTRIDEQTFWTGKRSEIISVKLRHWCETKIGLDRQYIEFTAKDRRTLYERWNDRKS